MTTETLVGEQKDKAETSVIIYARVSTTEQAERGFSINAQLEELRSFCAKSGYRILEEVVDRGASGASLNRLGIDRVRDLVANCDVSFVLVQDRDRISRDPEDAQLLRQELRQHGCELRSIKDRGTGTPEDALSDRIVDSLAEYERRKIKERTRRGKERRAKEGKIIRGCKPPYGFEHELEAGNLLVVEREALVVSKIYHLAAQGVGAMKIQQCLNEEGIPSPTGNPVWPKPTIRHILGSDLYKPHSYDEVSSCVIPEVLSKLDEDTMYGLWVYNQNEIEQKTFVEEDEEGKRKYRKKTYKTPRPDEQRIAVPVPSFLEREVVDRARAIIEANQGIKPRSTYSRFYPLRGKIRCSCGVIMATRNVPYRRKDGTDVRYDYYACGYTHDNYLKRRCSQSALKAGEVERAVQDFVQGFLSDSARLEEGVRKFLDKETNADWDSLEKELGTQTEQLGTISTTRFRYQQLVVQDLMTTDELAEHLGNLEQRRVRLEQEVQGLRARLARFKTLETDGTLALQTLRQMALTNLESLSPEEMRNLYGLLKLRVEVTEDRDLEITGVFSGLEDMWCAT